MWMKKCPLSSFTRPSCCLSRPRNVFGARGEKDVSFEGLSSLNVLSGRKRRPTSRGSRNEVSHESSGYVSGLSVFTCAFGQLTSWTFDHLVCVEELAFNHGVFFLKFVVVCLQHNNSKASPRAIIPSRFPVVVIRYTLNKVVNGILERTCLITLVQ